MKIKEYLSRRLKGYLYWNEEPNKINLDLGCGPEKLNHAIGIDNKIMTGVNIVADIARLPIKSNIADNIFLLNVLEHFDNPHLVLEEIYRVLKKEGKVLIRLPNIGTFSAHGDPTHKCLWDCYGWKRILSGYFKKIEVAPFGVKYMSSPKLIQYFLIGIGFKDMAQGFNFACYGKNLSPSRIYEGWWMKK